MQVKLKGARRAVKRGALTARVQVDRAATVDVSIKLRSGKGKMIGKRLILIESTGATSRKVPVKLKRDERPRRATVKVNAVDDDGDVTAFSRNVKPKK